MNSTNIKVAYLVAIYFLLSTISFSQENWTWLNPLPHGGTYVSADIFPGTNIVIAVGSSGLLMRSTNNGLAWTHIPLNTTANFYSVYLVDNVTGYIAGGGGALYRTTNSGTSWIQISNNLSVDFAQIIFLSSSTGFLLTGAGSQSIYRTTDGGENWVLVMNPLDQPANINCIYSDSDQKVFFGTSGGSAYSAVSPGWTPTPLGTLTGIIAISGNGQKMIAISNNESVYYSTDGGTSWLNSTGAVLTGFSPSGGKFIKGENAVIFSVDGKIARSEDYGITWINVPNTSNGAALYSVAARNGNSAILFGAYGLQYNSDDAGLTWNKPDLAFTSELLSTSHTVDGNPVWAAGSGGILISSTNGGETWSNLNSGITETIKSIKFVSDLTGFMLAQNKIYKTSDGGSTWSLNYTATTGISLNDIPAFDSDNLAVAGSSKNIYRTTNGGVSWVNTTVGSDDNNAIFALPGTSIAFIGGKSGKIYKSTDKCSTWNTGSSAALTVSSIYFTSSSVGWAVGNAGKIFKTTDGGGTWIQDFESLTTYNLRNIKFLGTDYGVITGNFGTVLKTTNSGTNWNLASKLTDNHLNNATLLDNSTVVVFGSNGTILKSTNAPLPVELTSFTARVSGSTVTLNWETKTEIDNYGFEIERKTTTSAWQKIGFVEGHSTTNSPKYYNFTDSPSGKGKYQYRLKQIDNDGRYEYSAIVEVDLSGMLPKEIEIHNFPNPFNPETNINIRVPETSETIIELHSITGEKLATFDAGKLEAGSTYSLKLDGTGLPSGVYFIHVTAGKHRKSHKIMLMK